MSRKPSRKTRKTGIAKTAGSSDPIDDFDLPIIEADVITTGAAADSSDRDEPFKRLSRLLRYAVLVSSNADHIEQRLTAEIHELCPNEPLNTIWGRDFDKEIGITLAAALDRRAVENDQPELRSLADCVRLVCLPLPSDGATFADYRRVSKALLMTFRKSAGHLDGKLRCQLEAFVFGWTALLAGSDIVPQHLDAAAGAATLGPLTALYRIASARDTVWRQANKKQEEIAAAAAEKEDRNKQENDEKSAVITIPEKHLVVARLTDEQMKNTKLKEILGPLKSVINVPLPLVPAPSLHHVRNTLLFEFPYAAEVIDFALSDLVGRMTVRLPPIILVGEPGGGKSRFARRLGEVLGLSVWREDASRADGATFGGTDRRWYSAEPCHPFLAIAQAKHANPMVQLEELEKAATRSDAGRLFDCLLAFLELETSTRYPDPALQVTIDLSQVSYVATCNSLDPLPGPLRDRFRVIEFPKPAASDLDALLPAVIADLIRERGLDNQWVHPLDDVEHMAVKKTWHGGSVRRLRRIVEAVLRNRELNATRN